MIGKRTASILYMIRRYPSEYGKLQPISYGETFDIKATREQVESVLYRKFLIFEWDFGWCLTGSGIIELSVYEQAQEVENHSHNHVEVDLDKANTYPPKWEASNGVAVFSPFVQEETKQHGLPENICHSCSNPVEDEDLPPSCSCHAVLCSECIESHQDCN